MRVGEWLAQLQRDGLSASRVRQAYRVLSLAMDAAVRERLLASSPCGRHHWLPRLPETEPTILTVADVEKLIAHLRDGAGPRGKDRSSAQPIPPNPSLALIGRTARVRRAADRGSPRAASSARRRARLQANSRREPHRSGREVHVRPDQEPPGSRCPAAARAAPAITRHLDAQVAATTDALVFTGRTGEPVHYTSVRRSFDAACRRVGLVGVTPHSLRASCASWVAESDGVLEAARRLGHSRSSVTMRHYARPMSRWRCGRGGTAGRRPCGRERDRQ